MKLNDSFKTAPLTLENKKTVLRPLFNELQNFLYSCVYDFIITCDVTTNSPDVYFGFDVRMQKYGVIGWFGFSYRIDK
jgi:hypothetical protein